MVGATAHRQRAQREEQHSPAQRSHSADPVAQRPGDELSEGQADQADRQGQLRGGLRAAQRPRQVWERGQVEVRDQWAGGRDRAQGDQGGPAEGRRGRGLRGPPGGGCLGHGLTVVGVGQGGQ